MALLAPNYVTIPYRIPAELKARVAEELAWFRVVDALIETEADYRTHRPLGDGQFTFKSALQHASGSNSYPNDFDEQQSPVMCFYRRRKQTIFNATTVTETSTYEGCKRAVKDTISYYTALLEAQHEPSP